MKDEAPLTIRSSAFGDSQPIPVRYTCDGDDISPPIEWSGVPAAAKSLVLVVDDPDAPDPAAPKRTWVHWVVFNIHPTVAGFVEGAGGGDLPPGTVEGVNDWKKAGYGGPCPPVGRHRYVFKLYALDCMLADVHRPTKADVERAMQGHVLARAEMVGTYRRPR